MNGKNKVISMLSVVILSVLVVAVSSLPAMAKERASRTQPARHSASGDRDRDHGSTDLSISFGLGSHSSDRANRGWVPGHYEIRTEKVLVEPGHYERQTQRVLVEPGRYEVRHVPAVYRNGRGKGREKHKTPAVAGPRGRGRGKKNHVMVRPARTEKVWVPPRYKKRKVKVWVPDRYEIREVKVWVPRQRVTRPVRSPGRILLNLSGLFRF